MGTGFNIIFIPFGSDNRPKGYYEEFLTGFLIDPQGPRTFGRPAGILEMKDGSLLFSEDGNGRIYRIEYIDQTKSISTNMQADSSVETLMINISLLLLLTLSSFVF